MTLLQLTTAISYAVQSRPELNNVWVTAELSDVRVAGGHCYMELIEKNAQGQTVAKIRANIWRNSAALIFRKFYDATGRQFASGLKVMLRGSATHHPLYGLSFNVLDVDPSYTLGDMERLRREILERLSREGIAGYNRSLPFPAAPQRIAVISAEGAAGYGDFINQLSHNAEGFVFYPCLFSAVMQGDRTAPTVMAALDRIESTIDMWDCVVIIRGGGATSDLGGFDNLELARRVAGFCIPVVVGIGHERDRTVLDELACVRCKTPTAVATFLTDSLRSAWGAAYSLATSIASLASDIIDGETRRLSMLTAAIPAAASATIERRSLQLSHMTQTIPVAAGRLTATASARLASLSEMARSASYGATSRAAMQLDNLSGIINSAATTALSAASRRLDALAQIADALSPDNTLRRGYSVTRVDGKALRNASQVSAGTEIITTLASGSFRSVVSTDISSGKQ